MARGDGGKKNGKRDSRSASASDGTPDDLLWRRVTETIKPLRSRRRPRTTLKATTSTEAAPTAVPRKSRPPLASPAPIKPVLPTLSMTATPGLDKRTAQRLGRGQLTIEARLDLHGLTQDEAHSRLAGFIHRSAAAGLRCVLVITGKGYKPNGETGILRQAVPRWLNEPGLRRAVVAVRHAQPKDGGTGALYVLLKRERGDAPAGKDAPPAKRLSRLRRGA
jgi:DNA-nicking Smr family endonuclease